MLVDSPIAAPVVTSAAPCVIRTVVQPLTGASHVQPAGAASSSLKSSCTSGLADPARACLDVPAGLGREDGEYDQQTM